MAKRKVYDSELVTVTPGNGVGVDALKEAGLDGTITAAPVYKNEDGNYRTDGNLPEGYSWVHYAGPAYTQEMLDYSNKQSGYTPQYTGRDTQSGKADDAFLSSEDYDYVRYCKEQFSIAQAAGDQEGMDYWHSEAEGRRKKYGYTGGADGSAYLPTMAYTGVYSRDEDDGGGYGSSGYLSRYQARIDALADAILNRDPFSYDKEQDPLYQQYKDTYTRAGQRGMQDTLAQVSARTGGLASSYAESAAQQTYNNYMAQLADKVPELYQLAYSMYMDDLTQDRNDLSMLMGLDDTAYGRWSDDRNFGYNAYRDQVADRQWQQQFDYNASRDQVADSQWQTQFDYQKAQDALAQQNWQTQWDYQLQQDALAREDALRKLYAGGVSGTEKDPSLWSVIQGMTPAEAEMYMVEHKYGKDAIDRAMSLLNDSLSAGQLDADIAGIKSEADAKSVMTNAGVDSAVMGGMLSKDNWTRRKQRGGTDPAVVNYDTYEEYVRDYVTYAIGE